MVYSSIIMRIIITLHFRRSRTASNFHFTIGRCEVGNHNMWLGSFWYVHTQVLVPCTLQILFIHENFCNNKTYPVIYSIEPFGFSTSALSFYVDIRSPVKVNMSHVQKLLNKPSRGILQCSIWGIVVASGFCDFPLAAISIIVRTCSVIISLLFQRKQLAK